MSSLLLVVVAIATVRAHNWVNSPSRSPQANTISPALPSSTGQPHVQVAAGQPFQIEWVQGHGGSVWFVFVAEKDFDKMKAHSSKMMDEYLNEAGATKTVPTGTMSRWHRSAKNDKVHAGKSNYFTGNVPSTDSKYILRDATFKGSFSGQPRGGIAPADVFQMIYPSSCLQNDRLTYHKSTTYPWVLGMRRASICEHEPSRPDVALFQFPKGTPAGNYMIHYRWAGYYDVIDVQIVANTVTNPYGLPLPPGAAEPPAVFRKIDHCEFKNPIFRYPCMRMTGNEKSCLLVCARSTSIACSGVNVVSVYNRPTVPAAFRNVTNIEYNDNCRMAEVIKAGETPDYSRKVCYGVTAAVPTDIATEFYVTNDPEDPAFYSTCWKRVPPSTLGTPAPPPPPPPMRYLFGYDTCLACDWAQRSKIVNKTSLWPIRRTRCVNCDNPGKTYTANGYGTLLDQPAKYGKYNSTHAIVQNMRPDGLFGNWKNPSPCPKTADGKDQSCGIRLRVLGNSIDVDITDADVAALIRLKYNTTCSDLYFTGLFNNALEGRPETKQLLAYCQRKTPACCLQAKLVPAGGHKTTRIP